MIDMKQLSYKESLIKPTLFNLEKTVRRDMMEIYRNMHRIESMKRELILTPFHYRAVSIDMSIKDLEFDTGYCGY